VQFSAEHVKRSLEKKVADLKELILVGPAPAPLERAETYYRYHLMLRTQRMSSLSRRLAEFMQEIKLPDDVSLSIDIDPVDLG
jgi:primosomal protein N' (replication factor Y)